MKTEQEKYYERKNREADELEKTIGLTAMIIFPLMLLWVLFPLWPLFLICGIIYLLSILTKKLIETIKESCRTLYDYIFCRREMERDLLDFLDANVILLSLFFIIVLMFSITLN